jgi:hypothetical protein
MLLTRGRWGRGHLTLLGFSFGIDFIEIELKLNESLLMSYYLYRLIGALQP